MSPRFAANLSMMFIEWKFEDRFAAARDAGFEGVEFFPTDGLSGGQLSRLLQQNELELVLANMPLRAGSKGFAALPDAEAAFKVDFDIALELALACDAPLLHVTAGLVSAADRVVASDTFKRNIDWAMTRAGGKVAIVIEAINQTAAPGYFIHSLYDARRWTREIPGLRLIMDVYHAAMEGLDVIAAINSTLPEAAHVQLAGWPGRHEPDVGQLPFEAILQNIEAFGYQGWVGCEYVPQDHTLDGLGWIKRGTSLQ
ncbi:TIM barrel protein [Pseudomonas sp. MAFF 301449]|uniref:TIM barrel protein n=1 Tax=Pseudomonas cyclaminis TaxID=2781239 RepID=A0ABR9SRI5_9PSED|nr:TIM barrel protein [Pseudomonas cyclaminis]MBE8591301.1 TIM barrel protein [Pseudomonas cyclaminis]MBE8599949.1 TIM barrel protein [Pseudomonas cyclaminis]